MTAIRHVLEAGTVTDMFQVEIVVTLGSERRMTDDEISDVIEDMVDDLDQEEVEPSVGTARVGDAVEVTVSVTLDDPDEWQALTHGVSLMRAAFTAASIRVVGAGAPRDLRSHVTPLQPA